MKTSNSRIALLTGASLSALGLAMPAQAQLVTNAGTARVVTDVNAVDTLIICAIDDTDADPECVYGQTNTGTGVVVANVIDTATGEISQVLTATGAPPAGGNVDGDIINNGDTEIRARATATDAAAASATALIDQAILQSGTGAGSILLDVDNNALLTIIAAANATAPDADALADINQAIVQTGNSTGTGANAVTVTLTNDADMDVIGTATATGTTTADASSTVGEVALGGGALSQTAVSAGSGAVTTLIDNNADIDITSNAVATVTSPAGVANSTALLNIGTIQYSESNGGGSVLADLNSTGPGNIDLTATATASGLAADDAADVEALAGIYIGVYQFADTSGGAGTATARTTNNDTINLDVVATAINADLATANGTILFGMIQGANNDGTGAATVLYAGTGDFTADVEVDAVGDTAVATGSLGAGTAAIYQVATAVGGPALATYDNAGTDLDVDVVATGTLSADATGLVTNGLVQIVNSEAGNAEAELDNDDDFDLDNVVIATATAGPASAIATIGNGIIQQVGAGADDTALAEVNNDDIIDILADATATGVGFVVGEDFYAADAEATIEAGIYQTAATAGATGAAQTLFTNNGTVNVIADSDAVATANATDAAADANASAFSLATGLVQEVEGTATFISTNNLTTAFRNFTVTADARATGVENADATADALGVEQLLGGLDSTAEFLNGGNFTVTAITFATPGTAGEGVADSVAVGYLATGDAFILDVENDDPRGVLVNPRGNFTVRAEATSADIATAQAIGMEFEADIADIESTNEALLDGTLVNDGVITVVADADGGPVGSPAVAGSAATATGILMVSGVNDVELTNTGTLNVDAITDAGGLATATGILIEDNGTGVAPGAGDVMTITNSGTIRVRESVNGGTSFRRGMAIDTSDAPNPVDIILLGTGTSTIYGDINLSVDDDIIVDNGRTSFDGTVNPECLPAAFETDATCGEGTLTITGDGELFLRDGPTPSYVFVDAFTMQGDGSALVLELPDNTTGGTAAIGTYPQVFADVATLNGSLLIAPTTTLFADSYFYNNVVDAVTRNGTQFDTCEFDGTLGDSVLLDVNCVYEAGNVDLTITRTAFGDVPGLTDNGVAVGEGLECIYDVGLTGGVADVFEDLFTFNAADYALALNQLAGAAYAGYLQSFNSLGVRYNDILDHATSCEVPALAGSVLECRAAPTHVWAQVDFQNRKTDGDDNFVGGYDADRWTALVGFDVSVGNTAIVGASVGRVTNRVDARQSNSLMKADGYQIGAYGVFDPGAFYIKALGSYNWYDGDSERDINFVPFGGTVEGTLSGDPDVRMWTLGAHMGARFMMGSNSALTPFLNIDYTNIKLKGFTETGLDGPELTLESGSQDRTTVTGGVKWAADIGGVVPEATLGYRYSFGDRTSDFTAFFIDDEDCNFDIVSEREKRGSILGGLSLGGRAGPVDVRVAYQGVFNGQATNHAGNFKIVLPFGGSRPAPAPVAYVPPPPPPPVEVAPAPVYTPPPPPPPSSGERG